MSRTIRKFMQFSRTASTLDMRPDYETRRRPCRTLRQAQPHGSQGQGALCAGLRTPAAALPRTGGLTMNPTYRMWITDASGRRISASGVRVTHEEMLDLLPLEKDRQRAYALVPNGAHMVDSDGDHWRRIN